MGIDNGCSGPISLDGVTTNNQTLNAPTLANPSITGNITLDGAATAALCTALTPCIEDAMPTGVPPSGTAGGALQGTYPSPDLNPTAVASAIQDSTAMQGAIASVFKDCNGIALSAGERLASCDDLSSAIDAVMETVDGLSTVPSGAAGGALQGTYPNPTLNPTAVEDVISGSVAVQNAVSSVFKDCNGAVLQPQARLIQCSEKGITIPYLVDGKIPATMLSGSVPEVSFYTLAGGGAPAFTGAEGILYIETTTGSQYRYDPASATYLLINDSATLTILDEGTVLTTAVTSIGFTGGGVTATASGANVTVTIPDMSTPTATNTISGKVMLNVGDGAADATNGTDALTAAGFNTLANKTGAGTPNAVQTAVTNAAIRGIADSQAAQDALVAVIRDDIRADLAIGVSNPKYERTAADTALYTVDPGNANGGAATFLHAVCQRVGNTATLSIRVEFTGVSKAFSEDSTLRVNIDVSELAARTGWFASVEEWSYSGASFTAVTNIASSFDTPIVGAYMKATQSTIEMGQVDVSHVQGHGDGTIISGSFSGTIVLVVA